MSVGLTTKQRALLEYLRKRAGQLVTDAEILETTGLKQASWRVYLNNGLHAPYLKPTTAGTYRVTMDPKISEQEDRVGPELAAKVEIALRGIRLFDFFGAWR
jgi:hypothetical protein